MKRLIFILSAILTIATVQAQEIRKNTQQIFKSDLPTIIITKNLNLHFRTPEPVQFVDLSTNILIGDLPTENVVRIKVQQYQEQKSYDVVKRQVKANNSNKNQPVILDTIQKTKEVELSLEDNQEVGIVTIVGQSFMAQYRIVYQERVSPNNVTSNIEVSPEHMQPLEFPKIELSYYELRNYSIRLAQRDTKKPIRVEKDLKLTSAINAIYTLGDYIFIDLSFTNSSNLAFDIDKLKFTIDDKKVYKSTNNQSIDIEPMYKLYDNKRFKSSFRNIYVFKKFTYPNSKVLNIRLAEEQISGRSINLGIKYSDILQADTF